MKKYEEGQRFRDELLSWFEEHKREMPWRGAADPYAVWVSEVMLQQTQVDRVRGYFERWMERFPTVYELAEASVEEVLQLWTGLGYYRRARFLHQAAQVVVREFEGKLPESAGELRKLPGIGPYTAGAIASIAFGLPEPVVDGNVRRVLSRVDALPGDLGPGEESRRLWSRAKELVDPERPGEFNQALMELGSLVCRVHSPGCVRCPVRSLCRAHRQGNPEDYPARVERTKVQPMRARSLIIFRESRGKREFLLRRRAETGLLAGLWEFPTVEQDGRRWPERALQSAFSAGESLPKDIGEVEHIFSHRHLKVRVSVERWTSEQSDEFIEGERRWVQEHELGGLATSALLQKILALFLDWRAGQGLEVG